MGINAIKKTHISDDNLEREKGEELSKEPLIHALVHLVEEEPVTNTAIILVVRI